MFSDACFEVLGSPFSLLSASISPSQNLYTRKGTLVGFNGTPENVWSTGSTVGTGSSILTSNQAVSTLSLLEPFRRALFGIPFLYQRVTSTTPYNALISTKSKVTSLVVVHLDGRLDWMVAQRNALLAWTGQTLSLSPRLNTKMVQSPYLLYTKCTGSTFADVPRACHIGATPSSLAAASLHSPAKGSSTRYRSRPAKNTSYILAT